MTDMVYIFAVHQDFCNNDNCFVEYMAAVKWSSLFYIRRILTLIDCFVVNSLSGVTTLVRRVMCVFPTCKVVSISRHCKQSIVEVSSVLFAQ